MNEAVNVGDDGEAMFLKSMGMSMMTQPRPKERMTQHDAAELFWALLTWRLQQ
jgi:hypothetical protein